MELREIGGLPLLNRTLTAWSFFTYHMHDIRSCDPVKFSRYFSTWLPSSYLAAKYELGKKLPSTYLAAKFIGRSMFSTNSYSNDCQLSTWQPS